MKGGSEGQWRARRAEKLRRAGSRLSLRGVAKNRAVFERLVRPSSAKVDRESRRRQVLEESMTRFEKSAVGSLDVEGPFTAVGDPYDDTARASNAHFPLRISHVLLPSHLATSKFRRVASVQWLGSSGTVAIAGCNSQWEKLVGKQS